MNWLNALLLIAFIQSPDTPRFYDFTLPGMREAVNKMKAENSTAQDQEFTYSESGSGGLSRMQLKYIFSIEHSARIWITRDYRNSKSPGNPLTKTAKLFQLIDCDNASIRLISYVQYGAGDVLLKSRTIPTYDQTEEPAVPGSIGEATLQTACKNYR
ncbi:surface-adhesin E family protein [Sphingomonas aerolata]|uniref:surface-adhesin E family protein n=1 Tax=Sphingomonas aerolata TaxID=185951 RepID=UPI002FDFC51A